MNSFLLQNSGGPNGPLSRQANSTPAITGSLHDRDGYEDGVDLIERFSLRAEILNAFRLLGLLPSATQAPKLASRRYTLPDLDR
jgi:hypothetical protein